MVGLAKGLKERGVDVRVDVPDSLRDLATSHGLVGAPTSDELMHFHLGNTYDLPATRAIVVARLRGRRVLITEHLPHSDASDAAIASRPPRPGARRAKAVLKRFQYGLTSKVIVVSRPCADFLETRYGPPAGLVTVVQNGVGPVEPTDSRSPRSFPHLVATGSIIMQKGFDILLDAGAVAQRSWTVDVLGTGTHLHELRERAAALRLPDGRQRIRFLGWSDSVDQQVSRADAVVVPSRWEAMPYSALEAMALGRAVIATAVDGLRDVVVDGETGFLVEPDAAALARALDAFAALPDAEVVALGEAGRRRVRSSFTLDQTVEGTLQAYRQVAVGAAP